MSRRNGDPAKDETSPGSAAGDAGASSTVPRNSPPASTRFQPGRSGNPKGRPKGAAGRNGSGSGAGKDPTSGIGSAFAVILDKTLTVTQGGRERALGMDEALQLRTYQEALGGSRAAQRMVLRMIRARERALAAKPQRRTRARIEMLLEPTDPSNADAALLVLGVASVDERYCGPAEDSPRIRLEPWAVQMALSRRRGGAALTEREVAEVTRCTRDADRLVWPRRRER